MRLVPGPATLRPHRVAAPTLLACAVLVASPALFGCGASGDGKPSSSGTASAPHDGDGTTEPDGAEASGAQGGSGGSSAQGGSGVSGAQGGSGVSGAQGKGGDAGQDGDADSQVHPRADASPLAARFANTSPYVLMTGYDKVTNVLSFRKVQGHDGQRFVYDADDRNTHRLKVSIPLSVQGSKSETCGQNDDGVDLCSEDGLLNTLATGDERMLAKVHVTDKSIIDIVEEKDGELPPG